MNSLDTDSFINSLRRFVSRRGPIQKIRCDNGTNFVSGQTEISKSVAVWNKRQVDEFCTARDIEWKFNVPASPHWGGSWEREIKTIKKTFLAISSEIENKRSLGSLEENLIYLVSRLRAYQYLLRNN